MADKRYQLATKVSLLYALAAGLWILLSDRVVAVLFPDAEHITYFQTYKGLAFVGFTAWLLYFALRRRLRVLESETSGRQIAQARLERNHQEYRRAIAAADAIPYRKMYGLPGYEFIGEGIKAVTGYGPDEINSAVWKELIQETFFYGEATGLTISEASRRALAGEIKHWRAEHRIRTRSGEIRWIGDSSVPVLGEEGKPVGSIGIIQDITDRKRADAALRESESRFRQLAASLPQLVWTCTPDGQCDYLSQQWVDYTGVPASQQFGRGWLNQIHPDDQPRLTAAWDAAVAQGTPLVTEYRIRRNDGTYRWFDDRAVALRDGEGRVVKWFGSNTDIHEQRALRETLRASEEKLRTIFEAEPECLMLLEADGTLREINSAGLRLLEAADLASVLGQSLLPAVAPEHQPAVLAALAATARGEARTMEFQIAGFQGGSHWVEMRTVPFQDPGTGRVLVLGVSRDISERRRAEEALRLSKERLRACIENTPNVVVQWFDDQGRVIFWNPASEKQFGWTINEALGRKLEQLTQTPEQGAQFLAHLRRIQETNQVLGPFEFPFHRKDGSRGECLATLFAIPFDAETSCFVCMGVNSSELKESRREVERSLSLLRATLNSTGEGILVVDQLGRITNYNQKFVDLWRIPPATLASGSDQLALAGVLDQLTEPEVFKAGVQAIYQQLESDSQDVITFKDGRVYERYSQPQRVGDQIVGRVWSFRDVTERRRVERLVVQSELRLRLVWENALHAMRLTDLEGAVQLVNHAYCRIAGKTRAELEGHSFDEVYAEHDRAQALALHASRFVTREERVATATEVTYWNGKRAFLEVSDVFLELSGESPLLLTIINDVTVRHLAEEQNRLVAAMVHELSAASSRTAAANIIVEAAQKLCGWDACFLNLYDAARDQFENLLVRDLVDGHITDVAPPPNYQQPSPLLHGILQHGPKLVLRDGTSADELPRVAFGDTKRLSASMMYVPVMEANRPVGILSIQSYRPHAYTPAALATLTSLAEHCAGALARIRAEEILQQSERRFRSLIENASDLITVINLNGTVRFQSPSIERVLGYKPEEMLGRNALELVHSEDLPGANAALSRILTQPTRPGAFEGRFRHRDGSYRRIQVIGRGAAEESGQTTIILNARDVTESRALEEQFRQVQKMEAIGQLAGGVAHDFNNLLAVIQMQVELLKLDTGMTPEQQDATNEIGKAAQRAANLTRQLLMFSRRQAIKPRDLDLNEVVGNVSKMLQRLLGEDVRVQVNYAPQQLFIHADQVMVDQVLLNLAVNSRDAMPGGGRLIIETGRVELDPVSAAQMPSARPGVFACLSVSDTGKGIPPEIMPHIFEPFFTTKDVGKGTGLGLATVFGVVQQHRGWIAVQSELGAGTTFRVYLPLLRDGRMEPAVEPTLTTAARGTETVLLVEDEASLRTLVRNVLSRVGYRVLEAPNGVAALELWEQHRGEIKLLLTDMVMPDGLSGRDLAARLLTEQPGLKVIYTSGYSQDIGGPDFPLREGENFLAKPFQAIKLAEIVRARLDA